MDETIASIYKNQNRLRSGAQNLMIMENMIGDGGYEVSDLAQGLNESVGDTLQFEEEFNSRGKIKKFFFGQKKDISEKFLQNISERDKKIERLKELYQDCQCSPEIKSIFNGQLSGIEEEQNRIKEYYESQTKKKGILSWFANIF